MIRAVLEKIDFTEGVVLFVAVGLIILFANWLERRGNKGRDEKP
jgi:hypothetical protein